MSIRGKLALSFTAIMALFAINLLIYFLSDSRRDATFQEVRNAIERQKLVTAVSRGIDDKRKQVDILNSILSDAGGMPASPAEFEKFKAELDQIGQNIQALKAKSNSGGAAEAEQLFQIFEKVRSAWEEFYANFGVDQTKSIMVLAMYADPVSPLLTQKVADLKERQEFQVAEASAHFAEIQRVTRQLSVAIFALSLTVAIAIAWWISRHIATRLEELRQGATRIGSGNLDCRIPVRSNDELGRLSENFNLMAEKLESNRKRLEEKSAQLKQQHDRETAFVNRLAESMRAVESGDYDQRLPVSGNDVWTSLYRGFNLMTEGLRDESRILKVAQDLSNELQIDALLQRIMRATTELLDADRSTLFVYDRERDELWSRVAQGLGTQEIRFPANLGLAGSVFTSGEMVNVSDPYAHPKFNPEMDRKTGYKTESILCMPIVNKAGEKIGVTQVLNKRGGAFSKRDEARLRGLTSQIAVSLENARLFEDVLNIKNYNESILKSSSNGLITLDKRLRVVTANEAAVALFGIGKEAVIGRSAQELFGDSNAWVTESILKVERSAETEISMDASLDLGSKTASVNLTAVPLIDVAEEHIGTLLMIEDITQEKRVRTTMARYMSQEVVEQLLEGGEGRLMGETQRVTILFADVRDFTTMSEALGARETVSVLNEYFEVMVDIIFRYEGILDKYIGDAIMALFGAPFEGERDAENALQTANQMLVALRELNQRYVAEGRHALTIGIGIGTGEVAAGSIGSSKRMEYTVIGDSVNLAARLESANKFYGTSLLLSQQTVEDLKDEHLLREIDLLRVKGKQRPVSVYEGLGHHNEASFPNMAETLAAFQAGLRLYRAKDWKRAMERFEAALRANPRDKPSQIYLERCRHHSANPPQADWDGVWEMVGK